MNTAVALPLQFPNPFPISQDIRCIILGGGRGTRLSPLTKTRCKPAVPLAGKYRLVDVPISNCLNAGYKNIYLLTQFNSASLHRHIQEAYKFDYFGGGFVDILSAEQTENNNEWYQGTADAVRQNLNHIPIKDNSIVIILSGDQLYRMDLKSFVQQHIATNADITIAAKPFPKSMASSFGVMQVDENLKIQQFFEKPKDPAILEKLTLPKGAHLASTEDQCLVSMGIYIFKGSVIKEVLAQYGQDFGKEILPNALQRYNLSAYLFDGYWEDIGTIGSFFEANLMLTNDLPAFDFFDEANPIYSCPRYLPASKLNRCDVEHSVVSDGCILSNAHIARCIIGPRSIIRENSRLDHVYLMGNSIYEHMSDMQRNETFKIPNLGIGQNCTIQNAIIDCNVRIGNNVQLSPEGKPNDFQQGPIFVKDGILIISKGGIIPDNTVC